MNDKVYTVELNQENLRKLINKYQDVSKALSGSEFKQYLLDKCKDARNEVMSEHLYSSFIDDDDAHNSEKQSLYEAGNKEQISGNLITLYNDSVIDIPNTDTFFNTNYRDENYPSELSLAELVEYGAGARGSGSSLNLGDEWEYEVNTNRDYSKGWYYKNGGSAQFSEGSEGKYIYYYLTKKVEDNINEWVKEYIDSKVGGV